MTLIETLHQEIIEYQKRLQRVPFVIGIDGRCGSGKSTLAQELSLLLNAPVCHMDDYYLPIALREEDSLEKVGGNIQSERFLEEVLYPLEKGQQIHYQPFNCRTQQMELPVILQASTIYIIEGAYSLLPQFISTYSYTLFFTHTQEMQQERLKKRVGETRLVDFNEQWIPLEERYFRQYNIKEQCTRVVDTTSLW